MLKAYLKEIFEIANRGDAREESYYSVLAGLLKKYTESVGKKNIHITTLPKKTEAGNPDFRIWDGSQHIVGYIEAKPPTTEYLEQVETSDQLKRYLHIFPNLLLTNFFEFRLYRNGTLTDTVRIAKPYIVHKLKIVPSVENESDFLKLFEKFFSFSLPKVYNAKTLAIELAKRTSFLKDEVIAEELKEEEKAGTGFILEFYEAFKKYLISGLKKEEFADLYSQTITYGLFAARTRSENGFNRKLAYDKIPPTIGILKDVFHFISLGKPPTAMEWTVDDISEVLAVTDLNQILHQYFHEHKGNDPVVHFYETFLAEYDPTTREKRGVYYTPEPVVSYIVRSLHIILQKFFDRNDGFASDSVTVLDPAAGTLTFLAEAAKLAVEDFVAKYGDGGKENFIKEYILKNFYAFELMMAPYAVGHLRMAFLLEELGYKLQNDDRFKLYLTNTLEMEELTQIGIPGLSSLSEESHLAGEVKNKTPILVILGNPPYSGHSANVSEKYITVTTGNGKEKRKKVKTWIGKLIENYKFVDGKPLGEKNPKWLQDDYVKFIRFAQWKINQSGGGILGFITNHSYLDNPTFRGMRQSLMASFDEIYILDLHGNSLKKERCPDGSKDENVFDIQQGVAIILAYKKQEKKEESWAAIFPPSPQLKLFVREEPKEKPKKHSCKVYHKDSWGMREKKYSWLLKNDIKMTKWKRLSPKSEFYLFIPREEKLLKIYESYPKITDIFPLNSVGVVTARDSFVIDADKDALKRRIRMFRDKKIPDEIIRQTFDFKDKSNWKLKIAREKVQDEKNWEDLIKQILYRPFDLQWIFYHDALIERPRREVMHHMIEGNLGLIFHKREELQIPYSHFLVTNAIVEHGCLSPKTTCYLTPLYLFQRKTGQKGKSLGAAMMVFEPKEEYKEEKPNLSPLLVEQLAKAFKKVPSSEQIFYYIYAILYSKIYRAQYAEFLKADFPRIPFTKDHQLFKKIAEFGKRLVDLHLLRVQQIGTFIGKFQGKGNQRVGKLKYNEKEKRTYINQTQYFEGITKDVWEYQIGGYQVCEKWLKDRKGGILSFEDIKHYVRVVTVIKKTIEIQKAIDGVYPKIEKETIDFKNSGKEGT